MHDFCLHSVTVKHKGGFIMVWRCFRGGAIGDLVKIKGIMNCKRYHDILMHHAISSGTRLIDFTLQHKNDQKNTANVCRKYVESKQRQRMLKNMVWLPQSPDCNPIKLL